MMHIEASCHRFRQKQGAIRPMLNLHSYVKKISGFLLPVSMDCPSLIARSVFSNVYYTPWMGHNIQQKIKGR
jgi:hypothetical protein